MAKHVENALKVAITVFAIATGLAALGSLGGIFATLKTIEAGALAIMSFIGTLAGGLLSKGVEASRDNFGAKVSTRNGTAPRQIVYGQCRVGGTITHMETSGTDNSILSMVVVLAGHEIESLDGVLINDTLLSTTASGNFQAATNAKFVNTDNDNAFGSGTLIRYKFKDGSQTTADSDVTSNSSLSGLDKFTNVAYVFIQMVFDSEAFGGGVPNMAFIIKGKKLYDPRESGHTFGDESTYEWSNNPALCVLDYITNTTYGLKATSDEILTDNTLGSFKVAANTCGTENNVVVATTSGATSSSQFVDLVALPSNTLIEVGHTVTGTGISGSPIVLKRTQNQIKLSTVQTLSSGTNLTFKEPAYTANGFTNMSADGAGVIEALLSSCAGKISYINGKFVMFAGATVTPQMTINDDNLLAPIQVQTKQTSGDTFNKVKSIYIDANNNYVATDAPTLTPNNPDTSNTYLSEDTPTGESSANYEKILELQLPFTDSVSMAERLGNIALLHTRQQTAVSVLCNIAYMKLQPFDWVYVNNSRLGYTNKVFEVISTNLEVIEDDGVQILATRLYLKEIQNAVYTFATTDYENPIDEGSSVSTGDFSVSAPTGLSVSATLVNTGYDLNVQWTNIADDNIQGTEILYGTSSGTYTGSAIAGKGTAKLVINNVKPNSTYYLVARHFSANNVFSSKTSEVTINTNSGTGITTPSAPTSLSATTGKPLSIGLSWTNPSNSDLRDIQIYRSTSSGFTPDDNTNLVRTIAGVPSVSQKVSFGIDDGLVAGTTYYFKVKAVSFFDKVSTASSEASGSFTKVEATDIEGIFSGYFHVEGSTTTALSDSAFNTAHGRLPIEDDILIMVNTSASPKVSKAYKYSGTAGSGGSFVEITNFTTGDLVVDGSIAGAKIIAGDINADRIETGTLTSASGVFGSISANDIDTGTLNAANVTISGGDVTINSSGIAINGSTSSINLGSGNFIVSSAGSITAISGTIGGFTLGSTSLIAGSNTTRVSLSTADGIHLGNNTFSSAPFRVTRAGELTATNANVTGDLETGNLIVTGNAGIHGEVRATSLTAGTVTVASINQEVWNEIDARTAPTQNGFYDNYDSTSTGTYYNGVATNFELLGSGGNGYLSNGLSISIRTSMVHGYGQQGSQTYTGDALKATFQFQYKQLPSGNWTNFGSAYVGVTSVYTIPNGFFYELDADPDASVSLSNGVYYQFRLRVTPTVTNNVWADSDANDVFAIEFAIQQSSTGTGAGTGTVTSVGSGDGLSGGPITGSGTLTVDSTVVRTSGVQTVSGNKTFANNIVIQGNLDVQGTTTTVDSNDLNVKDKNITINYSTGDSSATANGAGITIQDAVDSSTDATILWNTSTDNFDFSHGIKLNDSKIAYYGTDNDLQIQHTGTYGSIRNYTGNLNITADGTDADIVLQSDDGSGGLAEYIKLDGGETSVRISQHVKIPDGKVIYLGTDLDFQIWHSSTNSLIDQTGVGDLYLRNTTDDKDVIIQTDNGSGGLSTYFRADGSTGEAKLYNYGTLKLKTATDGIDIQGAVATTFGLNIIDPSASAYGAHFSFDDTNSKVLIGGVTNGTKNTAISIPRDSTQVDFQSHITLPDDAIIKLGASSDLQIYHDGSHSYIADVGTGDLIIQAGNDLILNDPNSVEYLRGNQGAGVEIKYNGSTKLLTTSTGIDVSGRLDVAQDIRLRGNSSTSDVGVASISIADANGSINFDAGNNGSNMTLTSTGLSVEGTGTFDTQVFLPKQGTATSSSNQFESATLVFQASGWDTNGSHNRDGSWTIKNVPVASNYPDYDLNFYEEGNELKFQLHGRGTSNHVDPLSATFHGNVNIKPDSSGGINAGAGRLQINGTTVIDASRGLINVSGITLDNNSNIEFPSLSNGNINLGRSGRITLYGDDSSHHSIASRNQEGNSADDISINTYGALYIDLDSNNNNTSGADFRIGRHSANTGTDSYLFNVSGETGDVGIGTASVSNPNGYGKILNVAGFAPALVLSETDTGKDFTIGVNGNQLRIFDETTTRVTLGSTGSLLIGKDNETFSNAGIEARANGNFRAIRDGGNTADFNRLTSDGNIAAFYKDGTAKAVIGSVYTGLGTGSPTSPLHVYNATVDTVANFESGDASVAVNFTASDNSMQIATSGTDGIIKNNGAGSFRLFNNGSERARIDSSGHLLVGKTGASSSTQGQELRSNGYTVFTRSGANPLELNRLTSDGAILNFSKDTSVVGSISVAAGTIRVNGTDGSGLYFANASVFPSADNVKDLGVSSNRFKDLHLSGNANIGNNLDVSNDLTVQGVSTFDDSIQGQQGTSATFSEFHVGSNVAIGIEISNLTTTSAVQTSRTLGSASTYRTFKLLVQATSGTSYHATEILLTHDGTTVYMTEYGTIFTGNSLATFDADISSGNVRLLVDPNQSASTTFKFSLSAIKV